MIVDTLQQSGVLQPLKFGIIVHQHPKESKEDGH